MGLEYVYLPGEGGAHPPVDAFTLGQPQPQGFQVLGEMQEVFLIL